MKDIFKIFLVAIFSLSAMYASYTAADTTPESMEEDLYFLAETLWGEAAGEVSKYGVGSLEVVANTVINRQKYYQKRYPDRNVTVKMVVLAYKQYSYWNDKNWSVEHIKELGEKRMAVKNSPWSYCMDVARRAVTGLLQDNTGGAMAYYATWMDDKGVTPYWARGVTNTSVYGHHRIVRGVAMPGLVIKDRTGLSTGGGTTGGSVSGGGGGGYAGGSNSFDDLTMQVNYTPAVCSQPTSISSSFSNTPQGYGLYSDGIAQDMSQMLGQIYKAVAQIFMLGNGIMCYATYVAGFHFNDIPGISLNIPHFGYLIVGLLIYLGAFFISMSIGMFFLDVSFKFGFAALYFPIAIALWPFPPTKNKLTEAFGLLLNNAMLYALTAIGVGYALVLINSGVIGDASNWTNFWKSIDEQSAEMMAENFSLSAVKVVVILFCLVFGFKIVESSIKDYLNFFFSDSLMSGMRPMNEMGTQALDTLKSITLGPAISMAKGVASTITGLFLTPLGLGGLFANKMGMEAMDEIGEDVEGTASSAVASRSNPYVENLAADNLSALSSQPSGGGTGENVANQAMKATGKGDAMPSGKDKPEGSAEAKATADGKTTTDAKTEKSGKTGSVLGDAVNEAKSGVKTAIDDIANQAQGNLNQTMENAQEQAKEPEPLHSKTRMGDDVMADISGKNSTQNIADMPKDTGVVSAADLDALNNTLETPNGDNASIAPDTPVANGGEIINTEADILRPLRLIETKNLPLSEVANPRLVYKASRKLVRDGVLSGTAKPRDGRNAPKIILKDNGNVVMRTAVPSDAKKDDKATGKTANAKPSSGIKQGFKLTGDFLSGLASSVKEQTAKKLKNNIKSSVINYADNVDLSSQVSEEQARREVERTMVDPLGDGEK